MSKPKLMSKADFFVKNWNFGQKSIFTILPGGWLLNTYHMNCDELWVLLPLHHSQNIHFYQNYSHQGNLVDLTGHTGSREKPQRGVKKRSNLYDQLDDSVKVLTNDRALVRWTGNWAMICSVPSYLLIKHRQ